MTVCSKCGLSINREKKKLKKFCDWQTACEEDYDECGNQKSWTCCAHLHESRVFICRFDSLKHAKSVRYACADARPPKRRGVANE